VDASSGGEPRLAAGQLDRAFSRGSGFTDDDHTTNSAGPGSLQHK
jgi:hypothetical protein